MFTILTFLFLFVGILSTQQISCDIECWLKSLQLIVPNQSITISVGQINITNLVCQNITLGSISSSVQQNQITASLSGISVNCAGNWAYRLFGPLGPSGDGTVKLQLSNSSLLSSIILYDFWLKGTDFWFLFIVADLLSASFFFLDRIFSDIFLGIAVIQGSDGLVSTVNLTYCLTKMIISTMSFEGGLSGWILDLFSSLIISYTVSFSLFILRFYFLVVHSFTYSFRKKLSILRHVSS